MGGTKARKRERYEIETHTVAIEDDAWAILAAVAPMAAAARSAVRAGVRAATAEAHAEALFGSLDQSLRDRLLEATGMLFAVEIGAAARRGLLLGATPQDRFRFFCQCLKDRAFAKALIAQYPALARRLRVLVDNWRTASLEMLARLQADAGPITAVLIKDAAAGDLVNAVPLGDAHRGGRRVHRLEFAGGRKLIYKPRPVAMEHGVTMFVRWACDRGLSPDMLAPGVLDRGEYGWVEYMESGPCGADGVPRFFRRQGVNLMLAHLLGATDLHFENVLAVGEYPVIVDWETLFNPAPPRALSGASGAALKALNCSVLRTLLLPSRVFGPGAANEPPRSADISALGYVDNQDAPFPSLWWEQFGTDAIRLRRGFGVLPAADCLPLVNGTREPAAVHTQEILQGFEEAYRFFERRRRVLSNADGPLARFRGGVQRHVLRPTAHYWQLLTDSWHPRFAQNARLLGAHLATRLRAQENLGSRIVRAEVRALMAGDVPYFSTRVGWRAPEFEGGRTGASGDGWKQCGRRLASMGRPDRERQAWMIALSMADLSQVRARPRAKPARLSGDAILALARTYGDRLCALAIVRGARASWLFPMISDRRLSPACVGFGLYHGLSGIALFLARLSLETGCRRYRELALMAAAEAMALYDPGTPAPGYDGAGGLAYALALIGCWLDKTYLLRTAKALVQRQVRVTDVGQDFMSGASGYLSAACAVAQISGDQSLIAPLSPLARELRLSPPLEKVESGLAHGAAGVGFALMRWGMAASDGVCLAAGKKLMRADARYAARKRARTLDPTGVGAAMLAWCRGELGAAWAELSTLGRSRAAERVVRALKPRGAGAGAMCPCHGLLGQVDFLIDARRAGVAGASPALTALSREALGRLVRGEACADHAHDIETPGLLMGLAGSGYTLLRVAAPARTPSPLVLDASR